VAKKRDPFSGAVIKSKGKGVRKAAARKVVAKKAAKAAPTVARWPNGRPVSAPVGGSAHAGVKGNSPNVRPMSERTNPSYGVASQGAKQREGVRKKAAKAAAQWRKQNGG